jgi:hypothetical protein
MLVQFFEIGHSRLQTVGLRHFMTIFPKESWSVSHKFGNIRDIPEFL